MPSGEKGHKICLRGSAGHFLWCTLKARPAELRRFSAIPAVMQPDFSATQTAWRSRRSGANLSLPKFPANREFNRESCKFRAPKTALLISKPHISEEEQAFKHKPEQGIFRDVSGNRIQLSAMRAAKLLAGAELLKPGSMPGKSVGHAGHAFLPERIPTVHAARPSSREFPGTTC